MVKLIKFGIDGWCGVIVDDFIFEWVILVVFIVV